MFGLEDLILLYSITAKTSVNTPIVIAMTKYVTAKKLFKVYCLISSGSNLIRTIHLDTGSMGLLPVMIRINANINDATNSILFKLKKYFIITTPNFQCF